MRHQQHGVRYTKEITQIDREYHVITLTPISIFFLYFKFLSPLDC